MNWELLSILLGNVVSDTLSKSLEHQQTRFALN